MKKTFIYIILIPCVAAISEEILHCVQDDVSAGSYKYYSLMYEGPIVIYLMTDLGDADLYVSQKTTKPTYDPDHYCLQSTTCGVDIIYIPQSFKRPVNVGVYGHPSHELSQYTLLVYSAASIDEGTPYYITSDNISTDHNFMGENSTFLRFVSAFMHIFESFLFEIIYITL